MLIMLLQSVEGEPHEKAVELLKAAQGLSLNHPFLCAPFLHVLFSFRNNFTAVEQLIFEIAFMRANNYFYCTLTH